MNKYMGRWYEIARLPLFQQKGCYKSIAKYELMGKNIIVRNYCLDVNKNIIDIAEGIAVPVAPFKYKIRFEGSPYIGDYWIEQTDYINYSIVGSPDKQYLWLLSRTPTVPKSWVNDFINWGRNNGYPMERLIISNYY